VTISQAKSVKEDKKRKRVKSKRFEEEEEEPDQIKEDNNVDGQMIEVKEKNEQISEERDDAIVMNHFEELGYIKEEENVSTNESPVEVLFFEDIKIVNKYPKSAAKTTKKGEAPVKNEEETNSQGSTGSSIKETSQPKDFSVLKV